jgi:CBS domain-containing protein
VLIRPVPPLSPNSSIRRAVDLLRGAGSASLAIVDARGTYVGAVRSSALAAAATEPSFDLNGPVSSLMEVGVQPARVTGGPGDGAAVLAATAETSSVVVVDASDRYVGIAYLADQLAPADLAHRPIGAGGMATPRGVYLTTGSARGGSGNWAIYSTGLLLGAALGISHGLVGLGAWAAERATAWPWFSLWLSVEAPRSSEVQWLLVQFAVAPIFLLLLRALPLAGYHGAEHKVINAMDQGEPLELDVVRRMSRVHVRCGTNLIAGLGIFVVVTQALSAIRPPGLADADGALIGGALAWLLYKRVGPLLQRWFTTREPSDHQLRAAISAANDLMRAGYLAPAAPPTQLRRLWCMGAPQTMAGVVTGIAAVEACYFTLRALLQ